MAAALHQAQLAAQHQEVPVGAVLVCGGKVITQAFNQTETSGNPTAHAEMLCIQQAALKLGGWRLLESTLYVTLEPCPMCAGALLQSRMGTLVYGARNTLLGDTSADTAVPCVKDQSCHVAINFDSLATSSFALHGSCHVGINFDSLATSCFALTWYVIFGQELMEAGFHFCHDKILTTVQQQCPADHILFMTTCRSVISAGPEQCVHAIMSCNCSGVLHAQVRRGVLAHECGNTMKQFFKERRQALHTSSKPDC